MSAEYLTRKYRDLGIKAPALHVVLGSGLSSAFETHPLGKDWEEAGSIRFSEIPNFGGATVAGHPGLLRYYKHRRSGKSLCFQAGRLHGYEGLSPRQVIKPVMSARMAGTDNFLITNASGALQPQFKPGSIMLIRDQVNMTGTNPLIGPNPMGEDGKPLGPRFPDMGAIYDSAMLSQLRKILEGDKLETHEGIYLGLLGPAYETPAEVSLYSKLGLGAVGMSTVWEAIALKHSGAKLSGLSVISNLGCGLAGAETLRHEDVEAIGRKVSKQLLGSLFSFAELYAGL